jgi:hypothetical protein
MSDKDTNQAGAHEARKVKTVRFTKGCNKENADGDIDTPPNDLAPPIF